MRNFLKLGNQYAAVTAYRCASLNPVNLNCLGIHPQNDH